MHTFLDSYSCIGSSDVPCVTFAHSLVIGGCFFFLGGGGREEGGDVRFFIWLKFNENDA